MGGALRRGPGARVQARLSAGERRDQYLRKRRAPQKPSVRSFAVPLSNDAPVPAVVQGGREKDVGEEAQTIGRGTTTREAAQEIARNVPGVIEHPIQKGRIPRTVAAALHYNLQKSRHISLNTDSFCRSPESRLDLRERRLRRLMKTQYLTKMVAAGFTVSATILALWPLTVVAQDPELQQKLAAVKEASAKNKQALAQYAWTEKQTVSLKG